MEKNAIQEYWCKNKLIRRGSHKKAAKLEIRRNVVKKIAALLEEKYMKATHIRYI